MLHVRRRWRRSQRDERREHGPAGGSLAQRVPAGLLARLPHGQSADGALFKRGN